MQKLIGALVELTMMSAMRRTRTTSATQVPQKVTLASASVPSALPDPAVKVRNQAVQEAVQVLAAQTHASPKRKPSSVR